MKHAVIITIASTLLLSACGKDAPEQPSGPRATLRILCGAGIRPAMEAIKAEFEKRNPCDVSVTYAGSGTLFGHLQAGVEADLYLPGDVWFIHKAEEKDLVDRYTVLAWFVPVIAVRKGNPKGIHRLDDLARGELAVGTGKADACAVGNVTKSLLASARLADRVEADFEALTVNRLANQIKIGALDAAIVWDATAKQYPEDIDMVPIEDADFHAVALAIGVLKQTEQGELARRFAEFAAGGFGAESFRENHYQVPGPRLRIGCGSSMRPPVEDLARLFRETTGREVLRDYGSSGTVLLQLEESREGDVYICHDPFAYTCEDRKIAERWHTIAHIEPTLAVPKGNPKNVEGLKDLLRTDLELGLPHRERSTRGQILWALFEANGMEEEMGKRRFFESRTHDLVNQLKLNAVDVAVLWDAPVKAMPEFEAVPIENRYKVDAVTSATSGRTYSLEHVKVTVVRLNFGKEPLLAAQFAALCLSDAGREILKRHGFSLPMRP